APPARQHRSGARPGRRGGAPAGTRPGGAAHRFRPFPQRGAHHRRTPAPPLVAAAVRAFGAGAPGARGGGLRRAHRGVRRNGSAPVSLRAKLLFAQVPILVALVVIGIAGAVFTARLGNSSQAILKDNYRSVLAAQRMKETLERMDSAALFLIAGER